MSEFNYIEYLRKNPLLTENTKLTLDHFLKHIKDPDGAEEAYTEYMETGTLDGLSDMDRSNISLELEDLNEDTSSLFDEKQMVMQQLLGNMQQISSENPEELTHDFLLKVKEVIDELIITDF